MCTQLIEIMMTGPEHDMEFISLGLFIPRTPHFAVTSGLARHDAFPDIMEIRQFPALTHLPTGYKASGCWESVEVARTIAAILEALPVRWDGTVTEIHDDCLRLPQPIRRWLREEVAAQPETSNLARQTCPSPGAR